jgi:hypothetical protein
MGVRQGIRPDRTPIFGTFLKYDIVKRSEVAQLEGKSQK